MLNLAQQYGADRMEATAEAALAQKVLSYPAVKQIMEALLRADDDTAHDIVVHANIRGPEYYGDSQLNGQDSCSPTLR